MLHIGCVFAQFPFQSHPFEDGAKLAILNARVNLPKESEHKIFFDLIRQCFASCEQILS